MKAKQQQAASKAPPAPTAKAGFNAKDYAKNGVS